MTNNEAIEHAKALIKFCSEDMKIHCSKCPFSKFKKNTWGGIYLCKLVERNAIPCDWELGEENG